MKKRSAHWMRLSQNIYNLRQIDRENGCLVVVRPDQYIAHVLPLDDTDALAAFFDGFMLEALSEYFRILGRSFIENKLPIKILLRHIFNVLPQKI